MDNVLKLCAVDVCQFVGGDDFHISHEEGRVILCIHKPLLNIPSCHTYLMDNLPVLVDERMVGQRAKNIYCTAVEVIFTVFTREEWPRGSISDESTRFILIHGADKGPE